jgi:Mrp family chromosome partitioning ATPase/capsular polysaccharide biosynthesis protein
MNETTDATALLSPLWKGKWLILAVGILAALGAYYLYKGEPQEYQAKTQLYLGAGAEGQALLNNTLGKATVSQTTLANQAELINSVIAEQAHRRLRREHQGAALHAKGKAKAASSGDFITITTEAHTARGAADYANALAQTYIAHHQSTYETTVREAIQTVHRQILRLERAAAVSKAKSGKGGTSGNVATLQTATLNTRLNQLESDLTVNGVQQIGVAKPGKAELLGPYPKRNAIFAFAIGLVLASLAVFVLSAFNRRLRTLSEIEAVFGAPVLTALPPTRSPIVRREGQIRASRLLSEPLRRLHSSLTLESSSNGRDPSRPHSILFLSADPGDGKSTVAAGLALTERDGGERVALVEADFRRPVMARLLGLDGEHGLADVLGGALDAGAAMQEVQSVRPRVQESDELEPDPEAPIATAVRARDVGSVSVLVGSTTVGNPPALLARPVAGELLHQLVRDYDDVLLDAPSPLQVSDVMSLLSSVDGIVIVARVGYTRQTSARRLIDLLGRTPSAPVLGVVANAVPRREIAKYGYVTGGARRRWPMSLLGT